MCMGDPTQGSSDFNGILQILEGGLGPLTAQTQESLFTEQVTGTVPWEPITVYVTAL